MTAFSNRVHFLQKDLESLEKLRDKSVLVTGASGVIGQALRHVFEDWVRRFGGHLRLTLTGKSLDASSSNPEIIQFAADLTKPVLLQEYGGFDYVIHGATYAQPAKFESDVTELFLLNVIATSALKGLAKESFLFLSTSEIYAGAEYPDEESSISLPTFHVRAPYVYSKLAGEAVALAPSHAPGKVARIALAYGPGFRKTDSRVLYDFFRKAKRLGVISLDGPADLIRTYCYATDVALDLVNVLANGTESIYNVGGVSKVSIFELASAVGRVSNVPVLSERNTSNVATSAPKSVELNLSRIESLRGQRNYVTLEKGLEEVNNWLEANRIFSNG